jgi:hypothetical protein
MAPQMNSEYGRNYGFPIRAVLAQGMIIPTQFVTNITLSASSLSLQVGKAQAITATVLPANADIQEVVWESSDENVADVTQNGRVVGIANGTCTITCRATDGSDVFAECQVTVATGGTDTGTHEFVDLGLPSGTLWATCNIGANAPEEYGNYFAWGETETKDEADYKTFANYKWCEGTAYSMTKYCDNPISGTVDNKTELEPEDDAATVNWGSNWQIPSAQQGEELLNSNYTTATWTQVNGVYGCKFTSKSNGNSIFLPAAGAIGVYDETVNQGSYIGYYWLRETSSGYDYGSAQYLFYVYRPAGIYNRYQVSGGCARCYGMPVRPVRKK